MNETQKPFACTISGCDMTFTNEDHLNWHHKKHDMVLNLEIENKSNDVADQTPTPTRFIRNCEEVGLFQDLQNVNPFDETFKKAIESVKSGTLHIPEASTDDTLHTPHIFPHVQENVNKYADTRSDNQSNQSDDFCIDSVSPIHNNNVLEENSNIESMDVDCNNKISSDNCRMIITTVNEKMDENSKNNLSNEQDDCLRRKLKEVIINKDKNKQCKNINHIIITPTPTEKLKITNETLLMKTKRNFNNIEVDENNKKLRQEKVIHDDKDKIREMNRAAQLRCRRRKQIQWKKMEHEIHSLKFENKKLFTENQNLKHKVATLKEMLLKHKNCDMVTDLITSDKIEDILKSKIDETQRIPSPQVVPVIHRPIQPLSAKITQKKSLIPLKPQVVPIVPNNVQSSVLQKTKPMFIQIVGSAPQLALSVSVLPQ